jgi:hypothetical protein
VGFLSRALVRFNIQGNERRRMLGGNESAPKSHGWQTSCNPMGLKPKKIRIFTPRINSKSERFIKTSLEE